MTFLSSLRRRQTGIDDRCYSFTCENVFELDRIATLRGHGGCVNCLEWSRDGSLLASGSDDHRVLLWALHDGGDVEEPCAKIDTGHEANIFDVKFLYRDGGAPDFVCTGAGDGLVVVSDLKTLKPLTTLKHHFREDYLGRVKSLAVPLSSPNVIYTSAEDGKLFQFDVRTVSTRGYDGTDVKPLYDASKHCCREEIEIKTMACHPLKSQYILVGCSDPFVRLVDVRMADVPVRYFCPSAPGGVVQVDGDDVDWRAPRCADLRTCGGPLAAHRAAHTTGIAFNQRDVASGEFIVHQGFSHLYLFHFDDDNSDRCIHTDWADDSRLFPLDRDHLAGRVDVESNVKVDDIVVPFSNYPTSLSLPLDVRVYTVLDQIHTFHRLRRPPKYQLLDSDDEEDELDSSKDEDENEAIYDVNRVRIAANESFSKGHYTEAIRLYSFGMALKSDCPLLYCNRAAAYLKRDAPGDAYEALRDCSTACQLDRSYYKAYWRLLQSMSKLEMTNQSHLIDFIKARFPDNYEQHKKFYVKMINDCVKRRAENNNAAGDVDGDSSGAEASTATVPTCLPMKGNLRIVSHRQRYCGHVNTRTDIKQAAFVGDRGQLLCCGSDDKSVYVYDKTTGLMLGATKADGAIVNCVQPHPRLPLIAASGIDSTVKLLAPGRFPDVDTEENIAKMTERIRLLQSNSEENIKRDIVSSYPTLQSILSGLGVDPTRSGRPPVIGGQNCAQQ